MAERSWPSPNHGTPARAVTDAEYPHLAPWASDGIFQSGSDVVYANSSGLEVHVRADKYGIVQAHAWTSGTAEFALAVAANASGATRVDTVVLRLDRSTWDVTIEVRQGTPGAGPPMLARDAGDTGLWEIPVADVTVDNGAATIAAGKVTPRPLLQSGAVRPCTLITDIQSTLAPGDIAFEASTSRWIGWTGASGTLLYEDTGWRTMTLTNSAWEGAPSCLARRRNGFVSLRIAVERVQVTFAKADPDGSPLFTVPADMKPTFAQYGTVQFTEGVATARVDVSNDSGVVSFQHNSDNVTVGRFGRTTLTYLLG